MTIGNLILDLLHLYTLIIIARAIMSWIQVNPRNPFVSIIRAITDPVLIPIQRTIPPIGGGLDISPIIAILLIQLLGRLIAGAFH